MRWIISICLALVASYGYCQHPMDVCYYGACQSDGITQDCENDSIVTLFINGSEKYISVKDTLMKFKNLVCVTIRNEELTKSNFKLHDYRKLKVLDIENDINRKLPKSICKCKNLELLFVAGNKISELPKCLSKLKKLTHIAITVNDDKMTEAISKIKTLKSIELANFGQEFSIHEDVGLLKSLKTVRLHGKISRLPNSFSNLKLISLDMLDTRISSMPKDFDYSHLKYISFSGKMDIEECKEINKKLNPGAAREDYPCYEY